MIFFPETLDPSAPLRLDMRTVTDTLRLEPALQPAWDALIAGDDDNERVTFIGRFHDLIWIATSQVADPERRRAAFSRALREYAEYRGIDVSTYLERLQAGDAAPSRRGPNRTKPIADLEPAPVVTMNVAGFPLDMRELRRGVPERNWNMIPESVVVDGPRAISNLLTEHEEFLNAALVPLYLTDVTVTASDGGLRVLQPLTVARLLGVTDQTLSRWRKNGFGPKYLRTGPRVVTYPVFALVQWLVENTEPRPVPPEPLLEDAGTEHDLEPDDNPEDTDPEDTDNPEDTDR